MKLFNKWFKSREQRDYWQTVPDSYSYGWIKKIVVAGIVFLTVYEMHINNTFITPHVDRSVNYIINSELDLTYLTKQLKEYALLHNIDLTAFYKVKTTLSKPADPLLYMQKPSNGKILVPYGWRTDAVLKREVMQEGIIIEAAQNENVIAAAPGTIKIITENSQYGKILIIDHGRNIETLYGNLREILIEQGESVSQGQIIAKAAKPKAAPPTVYFEVHENGKAINPLNRLRNETAAERK